MTKNSNPKILNTQKVVGVDIGATKTAAALIDNELNIIQKAEFRTPGDPLKTVKCIKHRLDDLDPSGKLPVGIAICGLLSVDRKRLLLAPNLKWENILLSDLFGPLKREFVAVNDGNAAAWGSYVTESGKGVKRFLSITMGTGLGGGVIVNGKLLFGAGELGHIKLDISGPLCGCGKRGCLESLVGGEFMPLRAKEWFGLDAASARELFGLAKDGNVKALKFWKKIGEILGYGLSGVVNLNGIQQIMIGGNIANCHKYFMDGLNASLRKNLLCPEFQEVKVSLSKWKNNLSLVGAGAIIGTQLWGRS
jgi:glucokinase